jgi:hypothetical protein
MGEVMAADCVITSEMIEQGRGWATNDNLYRHAGV